MKPETVLKILSVIFVMICAQIAHLMMTAPAQSHVMYCKHSKAMCEAKMTDVQHASLPPHKDVNN